MGEIRAQHEVAVEGPFEFDFESIEWLRLKNAILAHAWSPVIDGHRPGWCAEVLHVPVAFIATDGEGPKCPPCQNAVTRSLIARRPKTRLFRTSAGGYA